MTACCRDCGARISRYAPAGTAYCATHEPAHLTHDDLIVDPPTIVPRDVQCKRGHDLRITGVLKNTGHGRKTRKCRACDAIRQATYRQRRAAA